MGDFQRSALPEKWRAGSGGRVVERFDGVDEAIQRGVDIARQLARDGTRLGEKLAKALGDLFLISAMSRACRVVSSMGKTTSR